MFEFFQMLLMHPGIVPAEAEKQQAEAMNRKKAGGFKRK